MPGESGGSRRAGGRVRHDGAGGSAGRAVRAACLAALAATAAAAGEAPAPQDRPNLFGIGVLAASGLGSMSTDLNGHPGFGLTIQWYVPVAPRVDLRPAFEWTGYRVNEYDWAALALYELLGASYEDTRVVFRTYRLGLDGVAYLKDRNRGPYVSGGVGVQVSKAYVEDVVRTSDGGEDVTTLDSSSSTTGLWVGGGIGYASPGASAELRVSRAPYRFSWERRSENGGFVLPLEARPGWAVHLLLVVKLRV